MPLKFLRSFKGKQIAVLKIKGTKNQTGHHKIRITSAAFRVTIGFEIFAVS